MPEITHADQPVWMDKLYVRLDQLTNSELNELSACAERFDANRNEALLVIRKASDFYAVGMVLFVFAVFFMVLAIVFSMAIKNDEDVSGLLFVFNRESAGKVYFMTSLAFFGVWYYLRKRLIEARDHKLNDFFPHLEKIQIQVDSSLYHTRFKLLHGEHDKGIEYNLDDLRRGIKTLLEWRRIKGIFK